MTRYAYQMAADQAAIDARHARMASQDAQNPSDRTYAMHQALSFETKAAELRRKARATK